ncbi:MAG: 1-acyl-sn-glycerol-3-phosphate acyltransferase [Candidatus Parcubacteria bacterium]|nr:1-acyl-sn-glycerol-3-phosphate acyltransferase [Candidatus Parcubacteria bacterium]
MATPSADENEVLSISLRRLIRDRKSGRTIFVRISQFLTWPFAFVFFHLVYRLRINGRENLEQISSPFILIANHVSISGSFLFRLVLGFWTPHLPLRFMAVRRFNFRFLNFLADIGFVDFVYSLFGVFVVVPGRGLAKNLEEAKRIIKSRGNVVIYPEGDLEFKNIIAPFRPGASVLARETGAPVLPVSFRLGRRRHFRRKMTVNIGIPLQVTPDMSIEKVTGIFYATIGELYGENYKKG